MADGWRNRIVGEGLEAPDQLLANPLNWRIHPKAQQDALRAALDDVGWVQRVIVNRRSGHVVDGHLRVELAISRHEPRVPVAYVDLNAEEERLVLLTLDPLSALAMTDNAKIVALLEQTSLSSAALRAAIPAPMPVAAGHADPDDVPAVRSTAITPGDLFALGPHRLLCGDSTHPTDVARVLGDVTPLLMVTDPPYGVDYDPAWRKDAGVNRNPNKLGKVVNDDRADWGAAWALFPGSVVYVWHAGLKGDIVQTSLVRQGFMPRAQIIWAKDRMALSRGDYHWQHEPCLYAVRDGAAAHRTDDRTQTTLWTIPAREDAGHGHGTQKPVACMRRPMHNHTIADVYEPFAGSGTTIIAAEQLGRRCFAIEMEPAYVQITIDRWEAFTGSQAVKLGEVVRA